MEGFNHDSTVNNDDGIEARRFNLFIMRAVCGVSRNIVSVRHSSPPLITEHCHGFLHHPQHNHPLVCVLCVVIYIFSALCICYLDILADYIKADGGDKCGHAPPRLQMGALYRTGVGLHSIYCLLVSLYLHVITNTCSRGVVLRPQLRGIARD